VTIDEYSGQPPGSFKAFLKFKATIDKNLAVLKRFDAARDELFEEIHKARERSCKNSYAKEFTRKLRANLGLNAR
jgi:hypothetical protein